GNIWGYNLVAQADNPAFIEGLKLTAQAGLVMDSANPRADLVAALVKVKDKVPDLRLVLDHTPVIARSGLAADVEKNLRELAGSAGVYFKLSAILQMDAAGKAITDPATYKPTLDSLMDIFGEDRVIFGSDWPNSIAVDHLEAIVKIVRDYFSTKSRAVQE